jgi:perosamine synthetase
MHLGRTLPPAASPIGWMNFVRGLISLFQGESSIERFTNELKNYFSKKHCFLVSSGKAAFTIILLALKEKYPHRTDVIIPAYVCYSIPSSIVRAGLQIKPCDLGNNSLDFNFELLETMLSSSNVLAVLPTHLFGLPADVERIKYSIKDPQITIIEDAAQAMGAERKGIKLGTLGDVGFFSLGRGKAYSSVEGGVIITDDDDLAEHIQTQMDKLHGYNSFDISKIIMYAIALNLFLHPSLFWIPRGMPFLKLGETLYDPDFSIKKMSAFQAGLTNDWVARLGRLKKIRQHNLHKWMEVLDKSFDSLINNYTKDMPELVRLPVLLSDFMAKKRLLKNTDWQKFGISMAYPDSISGIPERAVPLREQDYFVAQNIAHRLVTLPVHQYLQDKDMRSIKQCLGKAIL